MEGLGLSGASPFPAAQDDQCFFEVHPEGSESANIEALSDQVWRHWAPLIGDYIWQRDPLEIHAAPHTQPPWHTGVSGAAKKSFNSQASSSSRTPPGAATEIPSPPPAAPYLWGQMNYGDNIEDEWFLTWLLLELTTAFPVSARIWDNDGEFLLIEAAYALPRWLKPEVAPNRVWLHQGTVHIIPPARRGGVGDDGPLTTAQALAALRSKDIDTAAAGAPVHNALKLRLEGFPERAQELMHRTNAILPAKLAHVLLRDPQLIAAASEAFYYRDPYDARAASRMASFPPQDMVVSSVLFSRCLYAQVALQTFSPPKGWPALPPEEQVSESAAAHVLGAKLTAGFEMLSDQRAQGNRGTRASMAAERCLQLSGEEIDVAALASAPVLPVDSEAWLHEGPAKLEEELQHREKEVEEHELRQAARKQQQQQGQSGSSTETPPAAATAAGGAEAEATEFDPSFLSSRMTQFVEALSGMDGAQIPDDGIGFDEDKFLAELQRVLGSGGGADIGDIFGGDIFGGGGGGRGGGGSSGPGSTSESSDEGSSFYSESGSDSEHEGEDEEMSGAASGGGAAAAASDDRGNFIFKGQNLSSSRINKKENLRWETATATDSDDDDHQEFMASYDEVLSTQLAGTTLDKSFVSNVGTAGGGDGTAAGGAGARGEGSVGKEGVGVTEEGGGGGGNEGGLAPVDLDVNLVSSLLASYREQGGLPGPASTLAGLLGVQLPDPTALDS